MWQIKNVLEEILFMRMQTFSIKFDEGVDYMQWSLRGLDFKWALPKSRYYPRIYLEQLREPVNDIRQINCFFHSPSHYCSFYVFCVQNM